jgi:hypothetical protein
MIDNNINKYVCDRCGHTTSTKSNLLQHLRKKKPCMTINSNKACIDIIESLLQPKEDKKDKKYQCEYCLLFFGTAVGKCKHKKLCIKRPELQLETTIKSLQEQINQLQKNHAEVIQELKVHHKLGDTIYNNTDNSIQNQQNIKIVIKNYGSETLNHLTPEFFKACLLNPSKGLTNLIEKIHYNPNVPENYNIRHKSTKQNILQKFADKN